MLFAGGPLLSIMLAPQLPQQSCLLRNLREPGLQDRGLLHLGRKDDLITVQVLTGRRQLSTRAGQLRCTACQLLL